MIYAIIGVFLLSLYHLVYESILAPSFRLHIRFKLFRLRDELRSLKAGHSELNDKHFHYVQDSINTLIANLARFDAATLALLDNRLEHDPELKRRADDRSKIMDDCNLPEARRIRKSCNELGVSALVVNSIGGWAIYILPVVVVLATLSELRRRIKAILSMPEGDVAKVVPQELAGYIA